MAEVTRPDAISLLYLSRALFGRLVMPDERDKKLPWELKIRELFQIS